MWKKFLAILAMLYAAASFAAVEINTASATDLSAVKGIGPALSAKIVEERGKGKFKNWDDLINRVSGIGEKNSANFSEAGLTVNGVARTGAAVAAPKARSKKAKAAENEAAAAPEPAQAKKQTRKAKEAQAAQAPVDATAAEPAKAAKKAKAATKS